MSPRHFGHLTEVNRDKLTEQGNKLLRLRGDNYVEDTRGSGDDYCWECGHIASREKFAKNNKCPSSNCKRPENWDD